MANEKPDSFQCGPFEVSRNPDVRQFVEKLNRLREAVDACRIQPGVGYTVNRSSGGTVLSIHAGNKSALRDNRHPWKVSLGVDDSGLFFTVEPQSYVNGERPKNLEEKIPLNTKKLTTSVFCVLRVRVSSLQVQSYAVVAMPESSWPGTVVPHGGVQTEANLILATAGSDGLVQNIYENLMTVLANNSGYVALAVVQP